MVPLPFQFLWGPICVYVCVQCVFGYGPMLNIKVTVKNNEVKGIYWPWPEHNTNISEEQGEDISLFIFSQRSMVL